MRHAGAAFQCSSQANTDPHPIWRPLLSQLLQRGQVRVTREAVCGSQGAHQARLLGRKLVYGAQRPQEHELRPELANSWEPLQALQRFITWHRAKRLGVDLAGKGGAPERVEILDLATEQPRKFLEVCELSRTRERPERMSMNVDPLTELA